jgi:hypothetical protein
MRNHVRISLGFFPIFLTGFVQGCSFGIFLVWQLYLLYHHLCQWLLEAGWGVSHPLGEFSLLLNLLLALILCP